MPNETSAQAIPASPAPAPSSNGQPQLTPIAPQAPTGVRHVLPGIINSSDRVDIDSLRDLSIQQYDAEYGPPKDESEPEFIDSSDPESEAPVPLDESPEEDADQEEEEAEDEEDSDEAEEGDEEDVEDELPEAARSESKSRGTFVKTPDGKSYKLPKDAVMEVVVDGERQELPVSEVLTRASASVNYDRAKFEIERTKEELETERYTFEAERQESTTKMQEFADHVNALVELSQNGSVEDFIYYYGQLTSQDPNRLIEQMYTDVVKEVQRLQQSTPRERELINQNRQYRWQQLQAQKQQEQIQKETQAQAEQQKVFSYLQAEGIAENEWSDAVNDIRGLIQNGQLRKQLSNQEIAEYAVHKKHHVKCMAAIGMVDKNRVKDRDFVNKVSSAIVAAERIQGKKFSLEESAQVVRDALGRTPKAAQESASRKVARAEKTGKAASPKPVARKQANKNGVETLRDHREWLWGQR